MKCIANRWPADALVTILISAAISVVGISAQTHVESANGGENRKGVSVETKYSETEASNLQKVREGFDAWRNGTGSPYQLLDENVSWTIVGASFASKEYTSRKAFIDKVITPFNQRMAKPLVPIIRNVYADGDTVIVFFDAEGTAKDGNVYRNTYSWFLRFKEGRINKAVAFFDSIHFNDLWARVAPTN